MGFHNKNLKCSFSRFGNSFSRLYPEDECLELLKDSPGAWFNVVSYCEKNYTNLIPCLRVNYNKNNGKKHSNKQKGSYGLTTLSTLERDHVCDISSQTTHCLSITWVILLI